MLYIIELASCIEFAEDSLMADSYCLSGYRLILIDALPQTYSLRSACAQMRAGLVGDYPGGFPHNVHMCVLSLHAQWINEQNCKRTHVVQQLAQS